MSNAVPDTSSELERFFFFRLSGRLLALPLTVIREVVPYCALTRPPAPPACLEGFANVRGSAIPVLRLDRLLSLTESRPTIDALLLFLQDGRAAFALVIDEALGIRTVARSEITPLDSATACNGCVSCEIRTAEGTALGLVPDQLLFAKEQEVLTHLRELEQRRLAALGGSPG